MRHLSAHQIKNPRAPSLQKKPRKGSRIREVYDLLQANKGKVLDVPLTPKGKGSTVEYLIDVYGLDIRNMGYSKWCLAGEWFGKEYVDYIIKNNDAADNL